MDEAVEAHMQLHQAGAADPVSGELHFAVMALFWRMRPHLRNHGVGWVDARELDAVAGENIYTGAHPTHGLEVEIRGFADLRAWMDKTIVTEQTASGPYSNSQRQETPIRLPSAASLAVADALTERYDNFGWDASADLSKPIYDVGKQPAEDHNEPIKDSIQKPQH